MSRTDKELHWRLAHAQEPCHESYPCKHLRNGGAVKRYRRTHQRHERTKLRQDLAAGRDPETLQHRHRAQWEAW
jgi:hypothetical protein